MQVRRVCGVMLLAAMAGCGGGGKGSTPVTPPAPTLPPKFNLSIHLEQMDQVIGQGDPVKVVLSGTWSATNLGARAVYMQFGDTRGTFVVPPTVSSPLATFSHTLNPVREIMLPGVGGLLTVRLCEDSLCAKPYDGTDVGVPYNIKVLPVTEWQTVQRDASHDGFMPVRLDPAAFVKTWEWIAPKADAGATGTRLLPVVTGSESVYAVGMDTRAGAADTSYRVFALATNGAALRWSRALDAGVSASAPAIGAGKLLLSTSDSVLTAIDAASGDIRFKYGARSGAVPALTPTAYGSLAYAFATRSGGALHAVYLDSGLPAWTRDAGLVPAATPMVNDASLRYHDGRRLIDHTPFGQGSYSIDDPAADGLEPAAVVVPFFASTPTGNWTIAHSFNGSRQSSQLTAFRLNREWATSASYGLYPALADGVIYAGRHGAAGATIDAIKLDDGSVRWSWAAPADFAQTRVIENLVATQNLLFVSTKGVAETAPCHVWAIDLSTRQAVWRYPACGALSLSASRVLYIATSPTSAEPSSRLIAIRLR